MGCVGSALAACFKKVFCRKESSDQLEVNTNVKSKCNSVCNCFDRKV